MKGKTPLVDKIRALLDLARSAGGTAEGQTARKMAERKMAEAGLTEEDVLADQKVAIGGRVSIWEQALMEVCAETSNVGLEVDRESTEWTLKGSKRSVDEAVERFHGIRDQLLDASLEYLGDVREGMREVGDDPSSARSTLDRMRRVFLESGTIAVYARLLEGLLGGGEEGGAEEDAPEAPEARDLKDIDLDEAPSRDKTEWNKQQGRKIKTPFDKLLERFAGSEDFDWDLEIDVADWVSDPSTAGGEVGVDLILEAPFPTTSKRRIGGSSSGPKQLEDRPHLGVSLFGRRKEV